MHFKWHNPHCLSTTEPAYSHISMESDTVFILTQGYILSTMQLALCIEVFLIIKEQKCLQPIMLFPFDETKEYIFHGFIKD